MSGLPTVVRRLPSVFYFLAVVFGLWRIWNEWSLVESTYLYAEAVGDQFRSAHFVARSTAIYWGFVEAAYLTGTGAMIHVLIAIYDKLERQGS